MMARLSQVVPALLTEDPQTLEAMVRHCEEFTDYVQFDIMDGQFVPSRSITCQHIAALPMKLGWEAHLMVQHPEDYLKSFHQAGAQKVVFHLEAAPSPWKVISQARGLGLQVGLAINPETPASALFSVAGAVDSVLFLTVHPGFYGSRFLPEVLDKVGHFRRAYADAEIGVDGGIKEGNILQIARLGVDVIYVGSAISLQPDPAASFRHLQSLAHEGSRQRE